MMLYQVNNKAQAIEIADYSVDNFLSVFEALRTKMSNLRRTRWVTLAHAVPIVDDSWVRLPYL